MANLTSSAGGGQLHGLTAVITGSSTGIGREIALEMSRAGAAVIIHGREYSQELSQTLSLIESRGGWVRAIPCDFTSDEDTLHRFVDACWSARGTIDVWVNNAGADILTGKAAEAEFGEKLELLYAIDIRATAILSRRVGQRMMACKGLPGLRSILNMSWDHVVYGMAGDSGLLFGAAKGAIWAMTQSLAKTLAPQVRVNCLAPGWIKTDWAESASQYWQRRARAESLMDRWGTPADVASAAVFLSSSAASFISGQVLPINGGYRDQCQVESE